MKYRFKQTVLFLSMTLIACTSLLGCKKKSDRKTSPKQSQQATTDQDITDLKLSDFAIKFNTLDQTNSFLVVQDGSVFAKGLFLPGQSSSSRLNLVYEKILGLKDNGRQLTVENVIRQVNKERVCGQKTPEECYRLVLISQAKKYLRAYKKTKKLKDHEIDSGQLEADAKEIIDTHIDSIKMVVNPKKRFNVNKAFCSFMVSNHPRAPVPELIQYRLGDFLLKTEMIEEDHDGTRFQYNAIYQGTRYSVGSINPKKSTVLFTVAMHCQSGNKIESIKDLMMITGLDSISFKAERVYSREENKKIDRMNRALIDARDQICKLRSTNKPAACRQ